MNDWPQRLLKWRYLKVAAAFYAAVVVGLSLFYPFPGADWRAQILVRGGAIFIFVGVMPLSIFVGMGLLSLVVGELYRDVFGWRGFTGIAAGIVACLLLWPSPLPPEPAMPPIRPSSQPVSVSSYQRSDGTIVRSHHRAEPGDRQLEIAQGARDMALRQSQLDRYNQEHRQPHSRQSRLALLSGAILAVVVGFLLRFLPHERNA